MGGKISRKFTGFIIAAFVLVAAGISAALFINARPMTFDKAKKAINAAYSDINPSTLPVALSDIGDPYFDVANVLPYIDDKHPVIVKGKPGTVIAEIFASTEKATAGGDEDDRDRWLLDMAELFNSEERLVGGVPVSVSVRGIESGVASDYISSGTYAPDAFSPASELWGKALISQGAPLKMIEPRLAGNVAGIVIERRKYNDFISQYGEVSLVTINKAVSEGSFSMGYTNPFASSAGANYLLSLLYSYNPVNPLDKKAEEAFAEFQSRVPFVAYTTLQMREAAEAGAFDGFVFEYQQFAQTPELNKNYVFTPFGVRHDNPLYAVGELSAEKRGALEAFAALCLSREGQEAASSMGFNNIDEYFCETNIDGKYLRDAQKLFKERKSGGRGVVAVFVADMSLSMASGDRLDMLKRSLTEGSKLISEDSEVGFIRFCDTVDVAVPIGIFDETQRGKFAGAVSDMSPKGGAAMYSAIITAEKLLLDEMETREAPAKYVIFLLSCGKSDKGYSYESCSKWLSATGIPIYTIDYEEGDEALPRLSALNGAAAIEADSTDVMYTLQSLFNAEM